MTTATQTIKVFLLDDCTWYAGESVESVRRAYIEDTGDEAEEVLAECGEPEQLDEEDLDAMTFNDFENGKTVTRTFREQLAKIIADGETFPCMFATTEY
jgi:hypothetical protein